MRGLSGATGIALIGLAILFSGVAANAASVTLSIVVNAPSSPSVSCAMRSGTTFTAPLAAGTEICPITVAPTGWSGSLALSGTHAASFAISSGTSGQELAVGSTALDAGAYSATVTATP